MKLKIKKHVCKFAQKLVLVFIRLVLFPSWYSFDTAPSTTVLSNLTFSAHRPLPVESFFKLGGERAEEPFDGRSSLRYLKQKRNWTNYVLPDLSALDLKFLRLCSISLLSERLGRTATASQAQASEQ